MRISSERRSTFNFGYAVPEMTIPRLVADKAQKNGGKVFMTSLSDGRAFTYAAVHDITNRIANALRGLGTGRGTHAAVIMENSPEQVLLYLALGKLGAVAVPINTSARGKLLAYFLAHSSSSVVVADAEFAGRVHDVLSQVPDITHMIVLGTPADPGQSARGMPVIDFGALEDGDPGDVDEARFSDLAMLVYTSGTTGPSKGNMLPQAAVVHYGVTTAESHGYRFDDVVYISLPLNHANAYLCSFWGAMLADASVAISSRFSVSRYWSEVRASGATVTNLLGSMSNMLWSRPEDASDHDNRMRLFNMVPVPKFAHGWERRFGGRIVSSYGQTDFGSATVFTLADPAAKLGSSGRPRSGFEIAIVDESDIPQQAGAVGELVLRTNNPWSVSQGYYKNSEATVAAFRNGWWHTGDFASVDPDGFIWFAERKKDAIRRRGENISAFEVEGILGDHPHVAESAVFAVKSAVSEEEVAVIVVPKAGTGLSEEAIVRYAIANMAHYMVPRYVLLADDLPRTINQKVQKELLRQQANEDLGAYWDREAHGIVVSRT